MLLNGVALSDSSAILDALDDRCEARPEFKATCSSWFAAEMQATP